MLQPGDFFEQDFQRTSSQACGVAAFGGRLNEDFHGCQRVAELVSEAGRHLAEGRELLATEHLAAADFQPGDDRTDLVGHLLQHGLQTSMSSGTRQGDRADDLIELARRIPNGDAELGDRAADPPCDPESGEQAGDRATGPEQEQHQGHAARHRLVLFAGRFNLFFHRIEIFLRAVQDLLHEVPGERLARGFIRDFGFLARKLLLQDFPESIEPRANLRQQRLPSLVVVSRSASPASGRFRRGGTGSR